MANFAVRLGRSSGWDSSHPIREQDGWDAHAAFMDGLVDDGFIILGGPVGSGEETLHVVEAADEDEIRERLADDPWASAGLLRIGRIEPWLLWLDGRAGNPARLDHASFHPARRLSRAGFNAPAGTGRGRTGKIATAAPVVGSGGGTQRERGTSSVAVGFDEMTRRILDGKNFPTVATIGASQHVLGLRSRRPAGPP
jgi:uncharacterized protein YciI